MILSDLLLLHFLGIRKLNQSSVPLTKNFMNRTLLFSNNSDRSRLKFISILPEFKELFQMNQAAGGINYLGTNDLEDYYTLHVC